MDQLVSTISSLTSWLQTPATVCFALALLFAGYNFFAGGERGHEIAKKTLFGAVIGFILVKLASTLASSASSKLNF